MIKDWYTAQELAEMKLDGMPTTDSAIMRLAKKNLWVSRTKIRGKGYEYQPPKAVMALIKAKELSAAVSQVSVNLPALTTEKSTTQLTLKTDTTALKDWQRKTAEARKVILAEVKRIADIAGKDKAVMQLVNAAAQNKLPAHLVEIIKIANAKRGADGKRTLSRTSIYRWLSEEKEGFHAIAPKSAEKQEMPAWAPYLMGLYSQPQKPTLAYCLDLLPSKLPSNIELPSYSAANRFLKKMSNVELQKGRMGSRELKNIKAFVRRDTSEMWPCDAYTADGHTFDAEVAHPMHGKPFRPEITTVLDIATRKVVGWSVGLAENTWGVVDALRHACLSDGIPAIFYVDNGSGFKNAAMSNESIGFMARLSITLTHSLPYNSQARGIEERSHQTIWVRGAKELPTYMGTAMDAQAKQKAFKVTRADLKTKGSSKYLMPWLTFIQWCQLQVDEYNNRPHRSLNKIYDQTGKKRHQSPNEAWAEAIKQGFEPVQVEAQEADDLFRPYKEAVTRRGEITLFTNTYFSQSLEAYHGETMRVGYDIHDASRVWVRNEAGQLVCVAEFEANKRSYFPQSFIEQAAEKRAKGRIQRAQVKIEEAQQELNPPQQLVYEAPFMHIPAMQAEETANLHNVVELKTKVSRPFFETDAAKYRWLLANDAELTVQDEAWINWYVLTDEYGDLFDDREVAAR